VSPPTDAVTALVAFVAGLARAAATGGEADIRRALASPYAGLGTDDARALIAGAGGRDVLATIECDAVHGNRRSRRGGSSSCGRTSPCRRRARIGCSPTHARRVPIGPARDRSARPSRCAPSTRCSAATSLRSKLHCKMISSRRCSPRIPKSQRRRR